MTSPAELTVLKLPIITPLRPLPEITSRDPAAVPPMVLEPAVASMSTPSSTLPIAAVPAAFVPIRSPTMKFEAVPLSMMSTPLSKLPEMTLPAPVPGVAVKPPIVLPLAPPSIWTPSAVVL